MISDFLKRQNKSIKVGYSECFEVRPRLKCKDGFSISVQASSNHYCTPRTNLENGDYKKVELGYPSEEEDLIKEYAETTNYTDTTYWYVPVEIVEKIIIKHDGLVEEMRL